MNEVVVELLKLEKTPSGYKGECELTLDIVKCEIIEKILIEQNSIPMSLKKYVGKKISSLRKNPLYVVCDATNLKYSFEEIMDAGEEYYLPTSATGILKINKVYRRK